jgi:hypothetical protein
VEEWTDSSSSSSSEIEVFSVLVLFLVPEKEDLKEEELVERLRGVGVD